ncbi:MAG: chemotaxis response regulator protein-glutamate methylesterase [Gaiellales bacterium]|nr:MAG: chemotaxis response regulator protein-glutamate methylesterase [Gaiellales bacterium]
MEAQAVRQQDQVRVLVADDSPTVRLMICRMLESDPGIKVIGTVGNGREATEQVALLKPDIVTMDVEMPVMNGLDAIEHIMAYNPVPILVVSSVVDKLHTANAARALGAGAVDVMPKPTPATMQEFEAVAEELRHKIKLLSKVRVITHPKARLSYCPVPAPEKKEQKSETLNAFRLVAIGSSTGGPQALQRILSNMPADVNAAILIVQHIAKGFTEGLVEWLGASCALDVCSGTNGMAIEPGKVIIAPEGRHMAVNGNGQVRLVDYEYPGPHKPAANVLLDSVAEHYGSRSIGVILTGMGSDGALGIRAIHDRGGHTIAQDSETSAIFSMAKEAIKMGGVDEVLPLPDITDAIVRYLYRKI